MLVGKAEVSLVGLGIVLLRQPLRMLIPFVRPRGGGAMDFMALLKQHDDPQRWEFPISFGHDAAMQRFRKFAEALSSVLGVPLKSETGIMIQDASFHSQIFLPLGDDRQTVIRFSNFGDMATVSEDDRVPPELLKTIVGLFENYGYLYVPASVLAQPYTGKNPGVTGIRDWWIRYFDWV